MSFKQAVLISAFLAFAGGAGAFQNAWAQEDSIAEAVEGDERLQGLFETYLDHEAGDVHIRLTRQADGGYGRFIHTARLTSGLGSNPVGLDRGYGTGAEILAFRRVGDRVFVEVENHAYRAIGAGEEEARATAQSFGRSVIWSTPIVAAEGEDLLIDLSDFLTRDAVGAAAALRGADQGEFSLDRDRSAPLTGETLLFPQNAEFDVLITLSSSRPGAEVRATAPWPQAVTLTQHHSFVALPEPGFEPRAYDPRSGAFETAFYDMAAPLDTNLRRGYANRHRLELDENGEVVEPIVFYVDRGAPEEIREALIEGGNWWAEAFEAAGFPGGYRVELLPEGVHPMDVRYNVVQWVHRQTRGWSYGASVIDPRTGEIIKGHVILGSQRVRQDRMIFEGLVGVEETGAGGPNDPLDIALARIRQLSAHEIGHTIGLAHNFAASTNNRASVMDYPAPLVLLGDAGFDLTRAYDSGIGEWDVIAVRWLYSEFGDDAADRAGQEAVLAEAREAGLRYISDRHARGNSSAHPLANLWDNGEDPVFALDLALQVRERALERFSQSVMAQDRPLADLRDSLPPLYLFHRYQVEAVGKMLGGVDFDYEMNTPGAAGVTPWDGAGQRRAISALADTLEPRKLDLPESVLALMAPHPSYDYDAALRREHVRSPAYPAFGRTEAAAAAAEITLGAMLDPARLARMADQSARLEDHPGPGDVHAAIERRLFEWERGEPARVRAIRQRLQTIYIDRLLQLAASDHPYIGPGAHGRLTALLEDRRRQSGENAFNAWLDARIEGGLDRIESGDGPEYDAPSVPPGSPIGINNADASACYHCDSATLMGMDR